MRWVDWLFERVYLPNRQQWARTRVAELLSRNDDLYQKLMDEVRRTEDAVRDRQQQD